MTPLRSTSMAPRFVTSLWQAREEPASRGAVLPEVERLGDDGLGVAQEGGELGEVHAVLAVVVVGVAENPSDAVGGRPLAGLFVRRADAVGSCQGVADEGFEALLGGVGGHGCTGSCVTGGPPACPASRRSERTSL